MPNKALTTIGTVFKIFSRLIVFNFVDTFHEVKSKRERRKEMKETQEQKTRANSRASSRGVRDGSEHSFGRSRSMLISSELGKAACKKENVSVSYIPYSASSKLCAMGQTWNEQPSPQSNSFNADYRRQSIGTGDMIDSSMQPSYGSQSSWVGSTLQHVAMADIVKMGRPKSKGSQMPCETSYSPQDAVLPNSTINQIKPSLATSDSNLGTGQDLHSDLNTISESGMKSSEHGFDNEWAVNEPMKASSDISGTRYSNQPCFHGNRANLSNNCWSDTIIVSESNDARKNLCPNQVSSVQASNKQMFMSDSGGTSEYDDDLRKDTSSPDFYGQTYEPLEGRVSNASAPTPAASLSDDAIKAASSIAVNLQQLSLGKEERAVTPKEDNRGVVLPDYLQAFSADCSHLSFGTYKSGKSTALSQPQTSSSLMNDLEETLTTSNGCSYSMNLSSRNLVYHDEVDFDSHRATADGRNDNSPKFSQPELRKLDIPDASTLGNDYISCASIPGSSFKNIQQSSSMSFVIDPNARNLPILPNKVPSSLALEGANPATGPVLKEHLYAYSYPQTGYRAVPQGHTYTPSALQQEFPNGNVFHESHMETKYDLQRYSSASMSSSLPWSSSYTSGYRSLENSSGSPGSFLHDLLADLAGSKVAYDDFLCSQYSNGGANFNLLQQNDGSATWDYRHGSRTTSTIPDNAYYSLNGQNHQHAGYQQAQQLAQQLHEALGYPSIYNSHAAMAIEQPQQQQQNLRDLILNDPQGPSPRQLPQTWQHNY
ncbi:kinase-related family protein [Gossypium australe]|uniref:Kinase-related family protein n=1 Tax=Gossypium australe TaxID=47621 RepID=A0A5B6V5R2_9ROSI|nr:kinase-related family protein [Gossypium australe]